uniref:Expressed protein n=2 Tax=Oryza sativa subsp. japonica TaxID=39947 RepID=Q2QQZ5_ORYSJ|nr:expressed protein [Oryza sativa Japonica Group]
MTMLKASPCFQALLLHQLEQVHACTHPTFFHQEDTYIIACCHMLPLLLTSPFSIFLSPLNPTIFVLCITSLKLHICLFASIHYASCLDQCTHIYCYADASILEFYSALQ